jgi:RNA polymerase sigma-70 factor (ECF subfamily)
VNAKEAQLKGMMLASLSGDTAAYRLLLTVLSRHLRSYYVRRLARHADAEDLVQETLIAVHARRGTYDAEQPFVVWLHAIARHKLIDYYRRARIRHTLPLEEATTVCADELNEATEAARDVEKLLAALPEARRALVRHVKLHGLSAAEAAERTGLSESAVRVGVHRAIRTLARMIREGREG